MTAWDNWTGRSRETRDDIVRGPALRLAATLGDLAVAGAAEAPTLPPLWHWLYFLDATPRAELGADGHAAKGGFLPPIDLPRRMYAGGRFTFAGPLVYGREATRRSTIASIAEKQGRSGRLAFVTVRHEIFQDGRLATTEEHDIVYREAEDRTVPRPPASISDRPILHERSVTPDEVMLFRFSALTFNGHRIHYDHPYVTQAEGYPGLIVHGPLVAMLLFEAARARHGGRPVASYAFRAVSPVFCGSRVRLVETAASDSAVECEARTDDDRLIMTSALGFG